jgi:hypothetical protein
LTPPRLLLLAGHFRVGCDGPPGLPTDDGPSLEGQRAGHLKGQQNEHVDEARAGRLRSNRAEVHQATGMILVQLDMCAEAAFAPPAGLRLRPPSTSG